MKAKFIIITFIAVPLFSFSQMNSTIDIIAGVDYSYRSLKLTSDATIPIDIIGLRNSREIGKFNWRFGFNYNKKLSNKFFLKTGIRLAISGIKGEKQTDLRWPSEISSSGYEYDPSLPHELQLIHNYWFLEIPLAVRYEFTDKKFAPFIEAGISPSYYLTTKTTQINEFETTTITQRAEANQFVNLHLVGVISFGANYAINEKMQLFGQAVYRRHLTKRVDALISEYLYNYGIEFGARRRI